MQNIQREFAYIFWQVLADLLVKLIWNNQNLLGMRKVHDLCFEFINSRCFSAKNVFAQEHGLLLLERAGDKNEKRLIY